MQNGFTCETTFNMFYLDHVSIQEIASLMSSNCNFCCGIFDLLNFEACNTCLYRVKCHKGTFIHRVKGVVWAFTVYLHFSKDHILLSLHSLTLVAISLSSYKGVWYELSGTLAIFPLEDFSLLSKLVLTMVWQTWFDLALEKANRFASLIFILHCILISTSAITMLLLRPQGNRRETRLLGILSFVHSTVWKVLFGKVCLFAVFESSVTS